MLASLSACRNDLIFGHLARSHLFNLSYDRAGESITAPGNRFDISLHFLVLIQNLSQAPNVMREICLFHKTIQPQSLKQFIPPDEATRYPNKKPAPRKVSGCSARLGHR